MGEKERFFLQIFLPVKVFFTGASGKTIFTGKPGLPEQRFTTLTVSLVKNDVCILPCYRHSHNILLSKLAKDCPFKQTAM